MTYTKQKMLDTQGERPTGRFYVLNREALVKHVAETLYTRHLHTGANIDEDWVKLMAPMTLHERQQTRRMAHEMARLAAEKRAK